ncbi:unnamed protein product, partial [Iphiclides podalirius]
MGRWEDGIKSALGTEPQLIRNAGYPAERHHARTADGYVLQMHRIRAGGRAKGARDTKAKRAVLLVHGLFGCSSNFVIMGPDRSLGYILADAGYDVWLGNLRGNLHTTHRNLTRDNPKFWDYSFHEHGKYDVPALIDEVLSVTGLPRLLYIGHSMGTTSFFAAMSLRPEYNKKVLAAVALAPAVYLDNMKPLAEMLIKRIELSKLMRSHGIISASLQPELQDLVISSLCSSKDLRNNICVQLLQDIAGEDYEQTDPEVMMELMSRLQPASWRQLEHFGKIALTSVFTSWGDGVNGMPRPYNLTSVRVPVLLLYGENDRLTEKSQVMRLAEELQGTGMLEAVRPGCTWPKFNHVDFIFAKDLGTLLNRPLLKHIDRLFKKYSAP